MTNTQMTPQRCAPAEMTHGIADNQMCQLIPELRAAYYSLLAGRTAMHVKFNERETTYHKTDIHLLRDELRRLEVICGAGGMGRGGRLHTPRILPKRFMEWGW
jgi:hypothetical protein